MHRSTKLNTFCLPLSSKYQYVKYIFMYLHRHIYIDKYLLKDDMVYLKGKGNGHGVGLCQEGAIIMASKGYDFKQILAYYYTEMYLDKIVKLRLNR